MCGNGVREPGEQCDDGNIDDGDLCPSSPESACAYYRSGVLIHGDHRRRALRGDGCHLEWYVVDAALSRDRLGFVATTQSCRDQDPGCDFDSRAGHCRFMLVACFNNTDPNLPTCQAGGVTEARVLHPPGGPSSASTRRANRLAIEGAFSTLIDPTTAGAGPLHTLPLSALQVNFCSQPFAFGVDRRHSGRGAASVIVDTFGHTEGKRWRERARLRLACTP